MRKTAVQLNCRAVKILSVILCVILTILVFLSSAQFVQKNFIYPLKFKEEIIRVCDKYDIERALIFAVVKVESNFDKNAVSNKGAKGLMQLTDNTANYVASLAGVDKYDIFKKEDNLELGCYYVRYLIDKFNSEEIAIVAYNAGEGNVSAWLKDKRYSIDGKSLNFIPFSESRYYLKKIQKSLDKYRNFYGKIVDK